MKRKNLYLINNLISGLGIICMGIIVIFKSNRLYKDITDLLILIYAIYTISLIGNFIIGKRIKKNKETFIKIFINIVLIIMFCIFPTIPLSILPIVFSFYLFLNGSIKFVTFIIYKSSNCSRIYFDLVLSIFFYIFALLFIKLSLNSIDTLMILFGIYSILLGLNRLILFLTEVIPYKNKIKLKKNIRMSLPLFLEAFIPFGVLKKINKEIDYYLGDDKENRTTNLEIFIHLSDYGFNQFGHTDICFDNYVYSYGNYDKKSRFLKSLIGDGVMFVVPRDKYIKFVNTKGRKTLISFGIDLSKEQETKLRNKLKNIVDESYLWYKGAYYHSSSEKNKDYTSKLYNSTKAKFYKFKNGKFKKYFVVGSNCTLFTDSILGSEGINIIKLSGILTPGTYYEFLESAYKYKNSNVVSKVIYKEVKSDKNKVK